MDDLDKLKIAYREVRRHKQSVISEMNKKSSEMILWSNGQCKDWQNYQDALGRFQVLEDEILSKQPSCP